MCFSVIWLADPGFSWGGGAIGRKARSPLYGLDPGSGERGLEALRFCHAFSCYLSLLLRILLQTGIKKKPIVDQNLGGGGGGAPVAPSFKSTTCNRYGLNRLLHDINQHQCGIMPPRWFWYPHKALKSLKRSGPKPKLECEIFVTVRRVACYFYHFYHYQLDQIKRHLRKNRKGYAYNLIFMQKYFVTHPQGKKQHKRQTNKKKTGPKLIRILSL